MDSQQLATKKLPLAHGQGERLFDS